MNPQPLAPPGGAAGWRPETLSSCSRQTLVDTHTSPSETRPPAALADEREFTFTTALQTHFAVRPLGDYPDNSRFVKLLGLGGKYILDYARDPSRPRLDQQEDDYVHFGGT